MRLLLLLALLSTPASARAQTFSDASGQLPPPPPTTLWGASSIVDVNQDGRVDIYRTGALYLNRGDHFESVVSSGPLASTPWGAVFADFDGDGLPDAYAVGFNSVGRSHPARLFTFEDVPLQGQFPQGSLWLDYDRDGWLDLFVGDDVGPDQLLRNEAGGGFENVSDLLALPYFRQSYGAAAADFDRDGDPDIAVGSCSGDPEESTNVLYRNDLPSGFADVASPSGTADDRAAWGVVWLDYDDDGWPDLFVANMPFGTGRTGLNNLFRNNGDGTFTDVAEAAGVAGPPSESSWSAAAADFDNDGWVDLYVANHPEPSRLYRNGGDGTFTDVTDAAGLGYIGRAAAAGDVDGDGWVDLFVPQDGAGGDLLFLNDGGASGWLVVHARGTTSNFHGVGARVEVTAGGRTQAREVTAGDGFVSQSHALSAHFGLGSASAADVVVRWPSGEVDHVPSIAAGQQITVVEGEGRNEPPAPFALTSPAHGSAVSGGAESVEFGWEAAPDPEGHPVAYRFYLAGPGVDSTLTTDTPALELSTDALPEGTYTWAVTASDGRNVRGGAARFAFDFGEPTSTEPGLVGGRAPRVAVYPNPSHGPVTVEYELGEAERVRVRVFDILGREIALVEEGLRPAGPHRVTWSDPGYARGVYFVRVEAGGTSATAPLILY